MSGYMKYFVIGGKIMSFVTEDDRVPDKYNEIWEKTKQTLNTKFHSMPVYNKKYTKAKVREFNGVIKTNFLCDKYQKKMCIALHLHSLHNY